MAIETIININANTKGGNSVKSIREEIKQARQEAMQFTRDFGEFSPEAIKATQRLASLKDEMEDLNERVAGLNPDRFQAIAGVVGGLASGISAAQGAMALFGSESEDVQKTLAKVQGAMAFASGIQQLISMQNALAGVATMIKTQVVTAFSTLKGAIAATGIGVLVIAIGVAIEKMNAFAEAEAEAADEAERLYASAQKVISLNEVSNQKYINQLKARGKTEEEIYTASTEFQLRQIKLLEEERARAGANTQKFDEEIYQRKQQLEIAQSEFELKQYEKRQQKEKEANDKRLEQIKAYNEKKLAAEKEFQEVWEELEQIQLEREQAAADASKDIQDQLYEFRNGQQAAEQMRLQKWYFEQKELLIAGAATSQEILALQELRNAKSKEIDDKFYEEKKTADQKKADEELAAKKAADDKLLAGDNAATQARLKNQQDIYQGTMSALGSLSQLFGAQTKAGKAFAITQIGIDTAKGISGAVAQAQSLPFPANLGAIAIGVSTVLANIARAKQILGESGNTPSAPEAPNVPQLFTVNNQSLRNAGIPNVGNQRVYVVESDITNAQGRVKVNRQTSVF
jgi:hypothetical protein